MGLKMPMDSMRQNQMLMVTGTHFHLPMVKLRHFLKLIQMPTAKETRFPKHLEKLKRFQMLKEILMRLDLKRLTQTRLG